MWGKWLKSQRLGQERWNDAQWWTTIEGFIFGMKQEVIDSPSVGSSIILLSRTIEIILLSPVAIFSRFPFENNIYTSPFVNCCIENDREKATLSRKSTGLRHFQQFPVYVFRKSLTVAVTHEPLIESRNSKAIFQPPLVANSGTKFETSRHQFWIKVIKITILQ